jgi:hypothetical protein
LCPRKRFFRSLRIFQFYQSDSFESNESNRSNQVETEKIVNDFTAEISNLFSGIYSLSTKKDNGFEQDDQTDPNRDEIHDFICPEQLETAAFPGKRKKPENAFVQMLLKCIEKKVEKGTAEKIDKHSPADRRFKQKRQKKTGQYHPERCVERNGPVFGYGKQNVKRTRENIRQNRSEIK